MDTEPISQEVFGRICAALTRLPAGALAPALAAHPSANFTTEYDIKLVSDGMSLARKRLDAKARQRKGERALEALGQAKIRAIPPQAASQIVAAMSECPELLAKTPLAVEDVQAYAANCQTVLSHIVGAMEDGAEADRVIRSSITQPMNVAEHNYLATLLISRIKDASTNTLFRYLDAVEATCVRQLPKDTLVHNIRLATKVLNSALDIDSSFAVTMSVEMNSFCLSYPWVKDAADLYKRALAIQQGGS
ncbi:hypothetical protein GGI12_000978 [Dipsacomyces acuminosporus]|nr:hypothetical protein GGI12_000978 [Dipsacomyces acuminosporus]